MDSERFVRYCATHKLELCDLWCPAGHTLDAEQPAGMGKWLVVDTWQEPDSRYWCLYEVEGGRAQSMEWYEDFWGDLVDRNPHGMSAAAACAMSAADRKAERHRKWNQRARDRKRKAKMEAPLIP